MEIQATQQQKNTISVFRIAGLNVAITGAEILSELGKNYNVGDRVKVDISFDVTETANQLQQQISEITWDKCCLFASAQCFYTNLLPYHGFALHASSVAMDGRAYLFSADSGIGKSTHTSLWCKYFGSERAHIIDDDKPVIRKLNGQHLAYGTPWCGSSGLNTNECVPIQGIAFIEQSDHDWIELMPSSDALIHLLRQTNLMIRHETMGTLLTLLSDFMNQVPIYKMGCTISKNAVMTAYKAMAEHWSEKNCIQTA